MFHIVKLSLILYYVVLRSNYAHDDEDFLRITSADVPNVPDVLHYVFNETGHPVGIKGLTRDYLNWFNMSHGLRPVVTRYHSYLLESRDQATFPQSQWKEVVDDLLNDVADVAVTAAGSRPTFNSKLTVTFSFLDSAFYLYIPYPVKNSHVWDFLKPYRFSCWIVIVMSLFVIPLCLYVLNKISLPHQRRVSERDGRMGPMFLYFLGVITAQGGWLNPVKLRRFFLLSFVWCLACTIFSNAYNGRLIAYLTLDIPKPIANSVEDIITDPKLNFYTYNNSQVSYVAFSANGGTWKKLADILRYNPQTTVRTAEECLQKVEEGPFNVCIAPREIGDLFVNQRYNETGSCTVTRIGTGILDYRPAFILRQGYKRRNHLDKAIIDARSYGLDHKWINTYGSGSCNCILNENDKKTGRFTKLGIQQTSGAFIVLSVGIIISIVCFVYENLTYARNKSELTQTTESHR